MKFHEILAKTEGDINKNCNVALSPLFPRRNLKFRNLERGIFALCQGVQI